MAIEDLRIWIGTIFAMGYPSMALPEPAGLPDPKPPIDWAKYMYRNVKLCGVAIFEVPESAKMAAAAFVQECLEQGRLWHRIDSRHSLADIADAHQRQETGRPRGKVIVSIAD